MKRWFALLVLIFAAWACELWWPQIRNEVFVIAGTRRESGGWYGLWSGLAGGLQIFQWAALGAFVYWHRTCHVQACLRIGRHPVAGTSWVVCRRHSPTGAPTHQDVLQAHEEATQSGSAR